MKTVAEQGNEAHRVWAWELRRPTGGRALRQTCLAGDGKGGRDADESADGGGIGWPPLPPFTPRIMAGDDTLRIIGGMILRHRPSGHYLRGASTCAFPPNGGETVAGQRGCDSSSGPSQTAGASASGHRQRGALHGAPHIQSRGGAKIPLPPPGSAQTPFPPNRIGSTWNMTILRAAGRYPSLPSIFSTE